MTRGVLYMVWGDEARREAARSIESVRAFGLDCHVHEMDDGSRLTDKALMGTCSPFDETLFLDSDTVVLDDPSFGFEMAARHGLALSIAPACWARRQWEEDPGARGRVGAELVEYNTGVVFFKKGSETRNLFARWREVAEDYGWCDQWSFAQAVDDRGVNPFVLPPNWNFRASPLETPVFGPIKVWHTREPVPENASRWNRGPIRWGKIEDGRIVPLTAENDPDDSNRGGRR